MKFPLFSLLMVAGLTLGIFPMNTLAAGVVTGTPVIIDAKAKARDILKEHVVIKNQSNRRVSVYAFVNNVTSGVGGGVQDFTDWSSADPATSLANWISVTRGVIELSPGEERSIDLLIEVNLNARPGSYHASVSFSEGASRVEAQAGLSRAATTMINVEVSEEVVELMQIRRFVSSDPFYAGGNTAFIYEIENIGNKPMSPRGEILIYDRRGKEVGSVRVNTEGTVIPPGETVSMTTQWEGAAGLGRYKAYLAATYGASRPSNLTDTAYFFILPWKMLLALFTALSLVVIALALVWHRRAVVPEYAMQTMTPLPPVRKEAITMPRSQTPVSHIQTINLRSKK